MRNQFELFEYFTPPICVTCSTSTYWNQTGGNSDPVKIKHGSHRPGGHQTRVHTRHGLAPANYTTERDRAPMTELLHVWKSVRKGLGKDRVPVWKILSPKYLLRYSISSKLYDFLFNSNFKRVLAYTAQLPNKLTIRVFLKFSASSGLTVLFGLWTKISVENGVR